MKAILISIQPRWCELIASGKKTIEVRKSKPKLEAPFKAYIYCTKARERFFHGGIGETIDDLYRMPNGDIKFGYSGELMCCGQPYDENSFLNGKVIGEFVCAEIKEITADNLVAIYFNNPQESTCLNDLEMRKYADGKNLFLWHISDLVIYDKPRSLGEFYTKCKTMACESCEHLKYQQVNSDERDYDCEYLNGNIPLSRPPQSWCYVEELM